MHVFAKFLLFLGVPIFFYEECSVFRVLGFGGEDDSFSCRVNKKDHHASFPLFILVPNL